MKKLTSYIGATAVVMACTVGGDVTTSSAYCYAVNGPATLTTIGAKEGYQAASTCDGLLDYWGYVQDVVTDSKTVMLEYTAFDGAWYGTLWTEVGIPKRTYGWQYYQYGPSYFLLHRSDGASAGNYTNTGF